MLPSTFAYDVFISYSRFDHAATGMILPFADKMRETFRLETGYNLRIFIDIESITASSLWEQRTIGALETSATLVVIQTPSYLTSDWCCRELDMFLALESSRREQYGLVDYESLLFPILLIDDVAHLTSSPDTRRRIDELHRHQNVDLSSVVPNSETFATAVRKLVRDLVAILRRITSATTTSDSLALPDHVSGGTPLLTTPLVTTRSGADRRKLTRLLADAQAATIVGVANDWVADCVGQAIAMKRGHGNPQDFWDRLSIIFLSDELLPYVNDELHHEFPDRSEALRERVQRAGQARRRIMSLLLRQGVAGRWSLHSYPFVLPFVGNLFAMPDGRHNEVVAAASQMGAATVLLEKLRERLTETAVYKYHEGHELHVGGIAGLQYRTFFSHLLPGYAEIGVPGARQLQGDIHRDARRTNAIAELTRLYSDASFMESLPLEV